MKIKKLTHIFSLLLALVLLLAICSCGQAKVDSELEIKVSVLNGTTGFGMAKLMNDAAEGNADLNYTFSVETDASLITAALIKGEIDIAALPTNAASTIYNKTEGGVQVLAINTLGVLYVVENGNTVSSLTDLEGKTVYCPAQNPAFIFEAICQKAGVNVTVDTQYAQPANLMAAVASASEPMIAVLPEPVLTLAMNKNPALRVALDLTAEWSTAFGASSLVQGCIVARTEFVEAHKKEIDRFLEEYSASIAFLGEDIDAAAKAVVTAGVYTNPQGEDAAIAIVKKAIPKCNVAFLEGNELKATLSEFLSVMHEIAPASVGGKLPADNFYYKK